MHELQGNPIELCRVVVILGTRESLSAGSQSSSLTHNRALVVGSCTNQQIRKGKLKCRLIPEVLSCV